jgi:protein-S-isoprenylcysteine O-methyltransferase Ste14
VGASHGPRVVSDSPLARIARWRVPAGFASAVVVAALARPHARSLVAGASVAAIGELLRVWAAGHVDKSREVTKSGPYRWMRHPLYAGSSLMGAGLALAVRSWPAALIIATYLAVTFTAAIRREEALLRTRFGTEYDDYAAGAIVDVQRRFSWRRAIANREYRAVAGFVVLMALLAAKVQW